MDNLRKFRLKKSRYGVMSVPTYFKVANKETGYRSTYRFGLTRELNFVLAVILQDDGTYKYYDMNTDDPDEKTYYLASELAYIGEYRKTYDEDTGEEKEVVNLFLPVNIDGLFVECRDVTAVFDLEIRKELMRLLNPLVAQLTDTILRG